MRKLFSRRSLLSCFTVLALSMSSSLALAGEKIVLAWSPAPQTPQIDIAVAKKLFEAKGLDVEVISFPSGRETFEALIGGQADIASMAELPAVTGALQKQAFGVVADLGRFNGSRIITTQKSKIASIKDLGSKRVGVTLGTNTDFLLDSVLKAEGVSAEIVNAAPSDLIAALMRGDVDAIVPFPGFYLAAQKTLKDNYKEIATPSYRPHFILSASTKMIDTRADDISAVLEALIEAESYIAQNPKDAAEIMSSNFGGNIDADTVLAMWKESEIKLNLDVDLLQLMREEGKWIADKGIIKVQPDAIETLSKYVVSAPLKKAAAERANLQ